MKIALCIVCLPYKLLVVKKSFKFSRNGLSFFTGEDMSRDIDDTRKRIGVGGLDEEQRKKLFREFIDHGGQVVDYQRIRGGIVRKKLPLEKMPAAESVTVKKPKKPTHPLRVAKPPSAAPKKRRNLVSAARINVKGLFLKVWGFGGKRLKESFVTTVKREIKDALVDIDLLTGSMLRGNSSVKREILLSSKGENSFLYECVARLSDIYDEVEWTDFEKLVSERKIPKFSYMLPLKNIFRKVYILGQYKNLCKLHMFTAVGIQKKHKKIEPETVERLIKGLRVEIDLVLDDFLKQLHILLCKVLGRYIPLYSQKLDDFLKLTEMDKIGYITRIEKKRRVEALKKAQEALRKRGEPDTKPSTEEIKIPKHVERGLSLVEEALQSYQKDSTEQENPLSILEEQDKMYRTLVLLDRFDSQYSFVLTTSKIVYNIDYVEQKKVDIKEDLNNAYIPFSETREDAKVYLETVREIKRIENDSRLTQYQKSVMLEKLKKKRHTISRKSRNRAAQVMKRIEEILSTVITDYKEKKILLQNPEGHLQFDPHIDGHKKLDGKRVIEAIVESFLFSATVAFLLKYGNLSGAGLHIEQEAASTDEE
jgi:hypothetical protein